MAALPRMILDDSPGIPQNVDVSGGDFDCVANNPRNTVSTTSGRQVGCRGILSQGGGNLVVENLDGSTTTIPDPGAPFFYPIQVSKILDTSTLKTFVVLF